MIEVRDLVYEYPTKRALHGVTLVIPKGSIAALVGPNGAGKTTLLRCLAALEMPYSGTVTIDGMDTRTHPRRIHARLGYLPDFYGLYDELSVGRSLLYAARASGMSARKTRDSVRLAAERVGLTDRMNTRAAELSRGLRQRLAIGQAIVHEPAVLLLDEPAAGLDPEARRGLSHLLLQLQKQGMTLLVSSHILAELEDYSSTMVIMEDGRIVGGGPISVHAGQEHRFELQLATAAAGLKAFLEAQPGVGVIRADEFGATISFDANPTARARLMRELVAHGFDIASFSETKRTMEQTYFEEVRRGGRS